MVIASGDCVYKMDYNKVLEYHIAKRADVTVVCTTCEDPAEIERFGVLLSLIHIFWLWGLLKGIGGTPKAAVPLGLMVSGANNSKVWKIG